MNRISKFLTISFLLLSMTACSNMTARDKSTAVGAGIGAVAGAALTGSAVGTVGGAAVGGVVGNQVGKKK